MLDSTPRVIAARRPMPIAGPVNKTLKHTMAFKGEDGLKDAERKAYEVCNPLSCKHAACYKRHMYSSPDKLRAKCSPLMDEWKSCFAEEMRKAMEAEASTTSS